MRLEGVGFSGTFLVSEDSAAGVASAAAATSGSLGASSSLASSLGASVVAGVSSVVAGTAAVSGTASSFLSSVFFSSVFFSLLPRRAPKMEVRFLLAERLRSSVLASLASSLAGSSLGVSSATAAVAGAASVSAAGVSSMALGVSSAFLSSTFLSSTTFSSFLAGVKEAMVDLYFSDSVTVFASSLASAIFSFSCAIQLSRSACVAALKVCLWPLEDRTNLLGPSVVGSAASA